jgi:tetratricopeptide (TPR) repeat protein
VVISIPLELWLQLISGKEVIEKIEQTSEVSQQEHADLGYKTDSLVRSINLMIENENYKDTARIQAEQIKDIVKTGIDSAIVSIGLGNYDQAEIHLNYALLAEKKDSTRIALIYFYWGVINHLKNNKFMAIVCYSAALSYRSSLCDIWNNVSAALDDIGQTYLALKYSLTVTDCNRFKTSYWFNRGNYARKLGLDNEAINSYKQALGIDPGNINAIINLGSVYSGQGNYTKAIELINIGLKYDTCNYILLANRAFSKGELNELVPALKDYDRAIACNPKSDSAWYGKGVILDKMNKLHKAIECYRIAVDINSNNSLAWNNLGYDLDEIGEYQEAIDCYNRAINISPLDIKLYTNRGAVKLKMGKIDEAINDFEHALGMDPDFAPALHGLCEAYIGLNDKDKALEYLNRSGTEETLPSFYWNSMGQIHAMDGNIESGLRCFDSSLYYDRSNYAAWANRCKALMELQQIEKAKACCDTAISINPHDPYIIELNKYLLNKSELQDM